MATTTSPAYPIREKALEARYHRLLQARCYAAALQEDSALCRATLANGAERHAQLAREAEQALRHIADLLILGKITKL